MRKPARCWSAILAVALLLPVASRARAAETSGTSWLGVYSQEITPELREGLDYNGQGVLVQRVVPDSPADRAGIERGDVIVRVGTRTVRDPDELRAAVRQAPMDRSVAIEIVREGRRKVVSATMAERAEANVDREIVPAPAAEPEAPEASKESRVKAHVDTGGDLEHFEFDLPEIPDITDFITLAGRGRLGVQFQTLNRDLAGYFGSSDQKGALVLGVTEDSPAEKAGIRAGDVITRVGSRDIQEADDLLEAVGESEGEVAISLVRHGTKQSVSATLKPRPEVLRLGHGRHGFVWREKRDEQPDLRRRILITGDKFREELRQEMEQLKQELKELRRELESRKDR